MWNTERVSSKVKGGQVAIGTHTMWGGAITTEIYGTAGYDMVWLDTEHGAMDKGALMNALIGCAVHGMAAFVRVAWNDMVLAKPVLDMGADGIIFPMILNAEQARQAVAACTYPPDGVRGFGPSRSMKYGSVNLDAYLSQAKKVWTLIQIEDMRAVENLDEILAVPGIDAIIIGPCDLSGSMGLLGQTTHPQVKETIDLICKKAREANMPFGVSMGFNESVAKEWIDRGASLIFADHEGNYLYNGSKNNLDTINRLLVQKDM